MMTAAAVLLVLMLLSVALDDATEAAFAAALATSAARLAAAVESATIAAQAETGAASIQATATVQAAKAHAAATTAAAQTQAAATEAAASTQAAATTAAAQVQASATDASAAIQAAATTAAASTHAAATTAAANVQAAATTAAAQAQAQAEIGAANTRASADVSVAGIRGGYDLQAAQSQADASRFGATQGLVGTEYSADKQLTGVNVRETGENHRLDVKIAWATARWDEVFPYVQDALTGKGSVLSGSQARWTQALLSVGQAPAFSPSEVWTPQQLQQQLNMVYAKSDSKVQSLTRTSELDLAGRGFSSDSPIMQAMRLGYEGYGMMATAEEESKIRVSVAQVNADQLLKSQSEALEVHLRTLAAYTDLEKNAVQLDVGVIGAAAQLLSGVV